MIGADMLNGPTVGPRKRKARMNEMDEKEIATEYRLRICERDTLVIVRDETEAQYEFVVVRDNVVHVRSAGRFPTAKAALTEGYDFAVCGCLLSEEADLLALRADHWVSFYYRDELGEEVIKAREDWVVAEATRQSIA